MLISQPPAQPSPRTADTLQFCGQRSLARRTPERRLMKIVAEKNSGGAHTSASLDEQPGVVSPVSALMLAARTLRPSELAENFLRRKGLRISQYRLGIRALGFARAWTAEAAVATSIMARTEPRTLAWFGRGPRSEVFGLDLWSCATSFLSLPWERAWAWLRAWAGSLVEDGLQFAGERSRSGDCFRELLRCCSQAG
jgi:hypothetical protein